MKKLLLISCAIFLIACSKSTSSSSNSESFVGTWQGTYSGNRTSNNDQDNGAISVVISKDSSVSGTLNSNVYQDMKNRQLSGKINLYSDGSGSLDLKINGYEFPVFISDNIRLKLGVNEISGHWDYPIEGENDSWFGQWEIHKK